MELWTASTYRFIDTQLIHAGEIRPRVHGAVSLPIFQSSTFESVGIEAADELIADLAQALVP